MKNKPTPFGKLIRQLRIKHDILTKDMAEAVDVSVAQLSALELGSRKLTNVYIESICNYFIKMEGDISELRAAADKSLTDITINLKETDSGGRDLAASFARKFPEMSKLDKEKISKLLNNMT